MKLGPPFLLSFNGGYVDTASFLALQGLFAAHVTGNFVTLAATLVHGSSGAIAKLLALPVFCAVILVARLIDLRVGARGPTTLKALIAIKLLLLTLAAGLALAWGPFADADSLRAIITGMTLVAAMAIQNGAHRTYLAKTPPSTLMTGTTTQITLDVADILAGTSVGDQRHEIHARLGRLLPTVVAFAAGCAAAALLFMLCGLWVFLLPPLVALATLIMLHLYPDAE